MIRLEFYDPAEYEPDEPVDAVGLYDNFVNQKFEWGNEELQYTFEESDFTYTRIPSSMMQFEKGPDGSTIYYIDNEIAIRNYHLENSRVEKFRAIASIMNGESVQEFLRRRADA